MIQHQFVVFKDIWNKDMFFNPELSVDEIRTGLYKITEHLLPTGVDLLRFIRLYIQRLDYFNLLNCELGVIELNAKSLLNPDTMILHIINKNTSFGLTYRLQLHESYEKNQPYYLWNPISDRWSNDEADYYKYLMFVNDYTTTELLLS